MWEVAPGKFSKGFQKAFTEEQIQDIEKQRHEMRMRLLEIDHDKMKELLSQRGINREFLEK